MDDLSDGPGVDMDKAKIVERLLEILAERFAAEAEGLTATARLEETVLIDSVAYIELVMLLERHFGLSVDRADLDRLATPQSIAELILEKAPEAA
jgi:acyl carrier protein